MEIGAVMARRARVMERQGLLGCEVSEVVEGVGEGVDRGLVAAVLVLIRFGGQSELVTVSVGDVFGKLVENGSQE